MKAPRTKPMVCVYSTTQGPRVSCLFLMNEMDDRLIRHIASRLGRDPSSLMNEAIADLIRNHNPSRSRVKPRLHLVKR